MPCCQMFMISQNSLCYKVGTRIFYGNKKQKDLERLSSACHRESLYGVKGKKKKSPIHHSCLSLRQTMMYQNEHSQHRYVNGESLVLAHAPDSWGRPSGEPMTVCFCSCDVIHDNKLAKKTFITGCP